MHLLTCYVLAAAPEKALLEVFQTIRILQQLLRVVRSLQKLVIVFLVGQREDLCITGRKRRLEDAHLSWLFGLILVLLFLLLG